MSGDRAFALRARLLAAYNQTICIEGSNPFSLRHLWRPFLQDPKSDESSDNVSLRMHRRKALAVAVAGGLTSLGLPRSGRAASGVRILASPEQLRPVYDYVIVGAGFGRLCGSAVMLGRAGRRVLIIEAGGPANLPAVEDPPQWPTLQGGPLDWGYPRPPPNQDWMAASCDIRAARPWEARARSTLLRIRGVIQPPMTDGPKDGATLIFYLTSSVPRRFQAAPASGVAANGPLHVLSLADVTDRTPLRRPLFLRRKNTDFG